MKKFKVSWVSLFVAAGLSLFLTACGSSSSSDSTVLPSSNTDQSGQSNVPNGSESSSLTADRSWQIGSYVYNTGSLGSALQRESDGRISIVVANQILANNNGAYSGSSMRLEFSISGSGDYAVTDEDTADMSIKTAPFVATIAVTAGTLRSTPTRWDTTTGTVSVSEGADGRYTVSTIEPLILTVREFENTGFASGIEGAPDQISFAMRNIVADPL